MIRRQKFHNDWNGPPSHGELLVESKKVLETRRNGGRKSFFVFHSNAAPTGKLDVRWREFVKKRGINVRLQSEKQSAIRGRVAQFGKARQPSRQLLECGPRDRFFAWDLGRV